MAGETSIIYEETRPEPERGVSRVVPTTWLLALWIIASSVAASGLTLVILTHPSVYSAIPVYAFSVTFGGPLFLLTWVWLAGAVGFRHRPFVVLALLWLVVWMPPVLRTIAQATGSIAIVLGALPMVSCIAVLMIVLGVHTGQARQLESQSASS